MLKSSLLILLSLATLATMCYGASVFNNLDFESRIFNGKTATRGQFPFYVFVRMLYSDGDEGYCSGTLINNKWVLTAGHCVKVFYGVEVVRFELHFGALNRTDRNEEGRLVLNTRRSFPHPLNFGSVNDIALLRLDEPLKFTAYIQPVRLTETEIVAGSRMTAIGFGRTQTGGNLADVLQFAELNHITVAACARTYPPLVDRFDVICAKGANRKSPCNGDSGGPLVVQVDNVWTLVGATSFGHRSGCHLGIPAGFANVHFFLQWIHETIAKN